MNKTNKIKDVIAGKKNPKIDKCYSTTFICESRVDFFPLTGPLERL